ncbi:MAG TPA: hypothetical protein DCF68_15475 [Cyanothece sp. UBA12306]|nr:hypothetical protein [Cyanothece sp. UBA12306]
MTKVPEPSSLLGLGLLGIGALAGMLNVRKKPEKKAVKNDKIERIQKSKINTFSRMID